MNRAWIPLVLLAALAFAGCAADGPAENPTAILETNHGTIELELFADLAPQTVQNFGELAEESYYDEQRFHRVIANFMIQGGDPLTTDESERDRWGTGGPGYAIPDEFACQDGTIVNDHPGGYQTPADQCDAHGGFHEDATTEAAGMLAMANSGPQSGGSQFFITLEPQPHLTGYHTVFGTVTGDMDVVEEIGSVETDCTEQGYQPGSGQGGCRDIPVEDVIITEARIEGELPGVDIDKQ